MRFPQRDVMPSDDAINAVEWYEEDADLGWYFKWLLKRLGFDHPLSTEDLEQNPWAYFETVKNLFEIEFYAVNPMDETRITDAMIMRLKFYKEFRPNVVYDDNYEKATGQLMTDRFGTVTVLEALAAMAFRFDEEEGAYRIERPHFWEWYRDFGLGRYCWGLSSEYKKQLNELINRWLDRDFYPDGVGSPWPLHGAVGTPQNEVPMWIAANRWENEQDFG